VVNVGLFFFGEDDRIFRINRRGIWVSGVKMGTWAVWCVGLCVSFFYRINKMTGLTVC
jgi:hypothetical protein